MKFKSLFAIVLMALVGLGAYWYWSPFLAVRELQTAAQQNDADTFNQHVDYPKVRESLKEQFAAIVTRKMGSPQDSGNPLAALGSLVGLGLVNSLVDAMVRPETVMAAMSHGTLAKPAPPSAPPAPADGSAQPSAGTPAEKNAKDEKAQWIIDRQGVNRMTAYAIDPARPDAPNAERLGLVFERSGFTDWKLTEIRMPMSAFDK